MTSFFLALAKIFIAFGRGFRDPEFRALFILLLALLISGTVFYSSVERWSVVDSLYFSITTLSTVGYGDLHPTTTFSKIFTMVYLVLGIGVFVGFITKVAQNRSESYAKIRGGLTSRRSNASADPDVNTAEGEAADSP